MIGFTGSTRTGRRMLEYAGRSNLKRVSNELGGKSASIVFEDFADVERAAKTVASSMFFNQGESCNAPSRVLVHEGVAERFVEIVAGEAPKYLPADPLDAKTVMGALVDDTQLRTVMGYIESGQTAGARGIVGGRQACAETGGDYVEPTVFDGVSGGMKIAREEFFGPVLSVLASRPRPRPSPWPMPAPTVCRPASGATTSTAPTASRARCIPAPCM